MAANQDPDRLRSASHRQMIAHLSGPFPAGAMDERIAIDSSGRVEVSRDAREPLLLIAPSAPTGARGLRLQGSLSVSGATRALPVLEYAPYTEAGAFLAWDPLPRRDPNTGSEARTMVAFTVALTLEEVDDQGNLVSIPAADVADRLEVRLLEGMLGRMTYLLGAEKPRLRRQGRELAAMRSVALARDDALDRIGADLGVPRLSDRVKFDVAKGQVVTEIRKDQDGNPVAEPDAEYRPRLALYRPFLMPTKRRVLEMLNGPGTDADAASGLLSRLGLTSRFRFVEADNEFGVAIHLISSGAHDERKGFIQFLRRAHLIWPASSAAANEVHGRRYLPTERRRKETELRASLRKGYEFSADAAIAPMLAVALDRAGQCWKAVGRAGGWRVLRAQDSSAGSRYEMGLGIDLAARPLRPEEQRELEHSVRRLQQRQTGIPQVDALLGSMKPLGEANDPDARWFWEACGLRTVHRIDDETLYLSHLPTFGMAITALSHSETGNPVPVEVRYEAPGKPGSNVALTEGLRVAAEARAEGREAPWEVVPAPKAREMWKDAKPVDNPARGVLLGAGLPAVEKPEPVVEQLLRLPEEMIATLLLPQALAEGIVAGREEAVADLRKLVELFQLQGFSSALPLITAPHEVLLLVAVIGLPEAGLNLSHRRATGFRWYVVPITGEGGKIKPVGSRTVFVPYGGLSALVSIGYARRGLTDPYEVRVELPSQATMTLQQYEYLMNLLEHLCPMGVEINTFTVRQRQVDLDGDGIGEPLLPTISKSYRRYLRPRQRGEIGVGLENVE